MKLRSSCTVPWVAERTFTILIWRYPGDEEADARNGRFGGGKGVSWGNSQRTEQYTIRYDQAEPNRGGTMATGLASPVSARNQIAGKVTNIQSGSAMSVITISGNEHQLVSAITNDAAR